MARPKREEYYGYREIRLNNARDFFYFRKKNSISQNALAEIVGISRRTIQDIENGRIIPQAKTIAKFEQLRKKYEVEGKPTGKLKTKIWEMRHKPIILDKTKESAY
jgi:DNA-binding XRE family transcriptional regulator